jgi:hypothetical protein
MAHMFEGHLLSRLFDCCLINLAGDDVFMVLFGFVDILDSITIACPFTEINLCICIAICQLSYILGKPF